MKLRITTIICMCIAFVLYCATIENYKHTNKKLAEVIKGLREENRDLKKLLQYPPYSPVRITYIPSFYATNITTNGFTIYIEATTNDL